MIWLAGGIGFVLGCVLALLYQERRMRLRLVEAETARVLALQEAGQFRAQHQQLCDEIKSCRGDVGTAREELAAAIAELDLTRQHLGAKNQHADALLARASTAERDLAGASAERDAARQQLQEHKLAVEDALTKMRESFAALSQQALQTNNEQFLSLAAARFEQLSTQASGSLDERKAQIESLLKPLQETLGAYQHRLHQIEQSRQEGYGKLLEQLGSVGEIGRNLERQTTQLVMALKRPTTRGQWGEITLRRLVELAGMSSHCDFTEQQTVSTNDDVRQRPDLVVHLPSKRTIVVDSKATLDKYLEATESADEQQRAEMLVLHAAHIRARARELAQRGYWNQFPCSPEFVVMFLPGEAFLYAAVERDPGVIEDAMKDRVIIATPTTLIALLKAVEYGWRQEALTENAEEIRKLGVELHERLAIIAGYLGTLGDRLKRGVEAYNSLVGSFDSRVMVTARKFGELGARSAQELKDPQPIEVQPRILTSALPEIEPLAAIVPHEPA